MEAKKENTSYITLLSCIAAISVVYLHTNVCFWQYQDGGLWLSANLIETFFYYAVPVFFMVSGATLMDYRERYSTKEYAIKRIKKTVIPFVIWSLLGLTYHMVFDKVPTLGDLSFTYVFNAIFGTTVAASVYWFFIPLFCVYACIPLLSAVPKDLRKNLFGGLCAITFVVNMLIPLLIEVSGLDLAWGAMIPVGSGYLFYVMMGYLLRTYELPRSWRYCLYALAIFGFALQAGGTYVLSHRIGTIATTFKGYENVPCVLQSLGVFVLFRTVGNQIMAGPVGKFCGFFKKYAFALYLLHWYVLHTFICVFQWNLYSLPLRLFGPLLFIAVSVVLAMIIRKIPKIGPLILPS